MSDFLPWCIRCGRTKAICKRDKGCTGVDPTARKEHPLGLQPDGFYIKRDGVRWRFAKHVADWSPWMKNALGRGTNAGPTWKPSREAQEAEQQFLALVLAPRIGELARACQLEPKPKARMTRSHSARSESIRDRNRRFFEEQRQCA